MSKIITLILIIGVMGGGVYFYKNYNKDNNIISSGTSISEVIKSDNARYKLESSFGPAPTDNNYITVDYKITVLGKNNMDRLVSIKVTCPKNISGMYHQNVTPGVEKCNTLIPLSSFTQSVSNKAEYNLTLSYKNTGTVAKDVVAEGFLGMRSFGKVTNNIGSTTIKPPYFNGFASGPAVKPVSYVVTKKSNDIPKIKIICPENIFAFDKSLIDNIDYIDVCNKFVPMKNPKLKTHEGENLYNFGVYFINQTQTSIPVSAEAQFDNKTIKLDKDVLILPTNSNISEIPKG